MKKLFSVFVAMLMLLSVPAIAQDTAQPTTTSLPDPGTTPDSWLYFLDLAMENLALAMTFDTHARVEKELEIAEERLAEIRAMALEGDVEAMAKAESKHGETMLKLQAEVKDVSDTDSEGELRKELEIERKIKKHSEKVKDVEEELEIETELTGKLTPEQSALIKSVLANLDGQTGKVEIEIENEKGKTKIKIEQEFGKSGEEVELELEQELGISDEEREDVEEALADAQEELQELFAEAQEEGLAVPEDALSDFNALIAQAQTAFEAGDYELAEELAEQAEDSLDDVEDGLEELEEEKEELEEEDEKDELDDEEDESETSEDEGEDESDGEDDE